MFPRPERLRKHTDGGQYTVFTIRKGEGVASTEEMTADGIGEARESTLSDRDRRILDFERDWQRPASAKEETIRQTFGLSATRYYQLLNALIDSPAAIVYDPMLVRRLQRVRDANSSARTLLDPHSNDLSRRN